VPTNAVLVMLIEGVHECPADLLSAGYLRLLDTLYRPARDRDIKGRALG
jgi:hypothetical protein